MIVTNFDNPKLLSVIIPVYNVSEYIERCVMSVIYQSYPCIEIILVDDGSTDGSGNICDKLSQRYANVNIIHKTNGGLSDARNAGLDVAIGEYICFIDGDDYVHKDTYYFLISTLEDIDADIAECGYQKVFKFKNDDESDRWSVKIVEPQEALTLNYKWIRFTSVVCNKVYKRFLFENERFVKGVLHEDEYTTWKVIAKARRLVSFDNKMYYYQQRKDSITGSYLTERRVHGFIGAFKERIDFDNKNNPELFVIGLDRYRNLLWGRLAYLRWNKRHYSEKHKTYKSLLKEIIRLHNVYGYTSILSYKKKLIIYLAIINKDVFLLLYIFYIKFLKASI
jgi:glycosyltransferase involved in cell wall biosynthesis